MSFAAWVRRGLNHTRWVPSGSPPLYRLMLLGSLLSSFFQIALQKAPVSVQSTSPSWFDWVFIAFQAVASIIVIWSLYREDGSSHDAEKLYTSLFWELFGLSILQTVTAVNVVAVIIYNGAPPSSQSTWYQVVFWSWVWFRMREIRKGLRELAAT